MIDQFIQSYRLERQLGLNPTTLLYLARDLTTDQLVSVKIFTNQPTFDDHFLARFEHEIELIRSFEHPRAVPILSYGVRNRQPFFVTPYMPGGSFEDHLRRSSVSLREISRLLSELADPLDTAHRLGLVHRNLKPSNIMFDGAENIYLADFGLTQMTDAAAMLAGTRVLGTPEYMSPEQVIGRHTVDGRSDIYALGVILFRVLVGQLPYQAESAIGTMLAHLSHEIPRPAESGISLPHGCEAVIFKAMAKEREARFSTVREFAHVLEMITRSGAGSAAFPLQFSTQVMIKP